LKVPLGCMNRPYTRFDFEQALRGIAGAGFTEFVLLGQQRRLLISAAASTAEADEAHQFIQRHGLHLVMLPSSLSLKDGDDAAYEAGTRLVDHASRLKVPYLLEMGVHQLDSYERYFALMRRLAPYAQERAVTIAVKPHGGVTTTAADCLATLRAVDHPAYRLCFDPGNLLYYANERPEARLAELAPYTVAMCVKDETGGLRGSVDVTPGDGDVDFPTVFRILRDHGFSGPCVVETLAARDTVEEVDNEAKRAYRYLNEVLAAL